MTEAFNFQAKRSLLIGASARVADLEETLLYIGRHYYQQIQVTGTRGAEVSDHVKAILNKADHHGLDIIDSTPPGSKLKLCMKNELKLIAACVA